MKLIVRQGGDEREVSIERDGAKSIVAVDGSSLEVEVRRLGGGVRSLLWEGAHHEVSVRHLGDDRYEVSGAFGTEIVEVLDPLPHLAATAHEAQAGTGRQRVIAYMPGRVVKVLVSEGESVAAGQGVVVLEAMKMENEIQAERDGVVGKLFVSEGQAVEGGDDLYELE